MIETKRLAVVVPAYGAGRLLAQTVATMPAAVDLIVVVDDASTDGSAHPDALGGDGRVVVVRHALNRGVGAAIVTGYRAARARGADVIAVMAGDAQMDPEDLPAVALPVARGHADYVKGNRLRHPAVRDMPFARRWGTRALGALTAWAIDEPGLSDSQCGYTAIAGELVERLPLEGMWPRYGYPNDLLGLVKAAGGVIAEVTVRPVYGDERSGLRAWHTVAIVGLIARAGVRLRSRVESSSR